MDDKKMSCGQEVGMSSGKAPMRSLHENECTMFGEASGNSLIEPLLSPDGPVLRKSSAEVHVHLRRKRSGRETFSFVPNIYKVPQRIRPANKDAFDPYEPQIVSIGPYQTFSFVPNIYKVPQRIRPANKDAFDPYEPQIVSIGPYHHLEKKEFEKHKERSEFEKQKDREFEKYRERYEFEKHKEQYQKAILLRNPNYQLKDYHTAIAKLENEARSYYSEDVGLDYNAKLEYEARSFYSEDVSLDCNAKLENEARSNYSEDVVLDCNAKLENEARSYYSEFVKMMVLDGCFIVELFLRQKEREQSEDPIFSTIWMRRLITYDMLLLENQIPFFVLDIIYKKACPMNGSLVKLAIDFFEPIMPKNKEKKIEVSNDQINGRCYCHLLHLFHSYLMPTPREKSKKCKILMFLCSKGSNEAELPISNNQSPPIKMIPSAAELQLAGVKFKKKKYFGSILDVEFSGGVLKIPQLCIDDYTNTLLRNLVALEQFCYPRIVKLHFTNYVGFMDCLVNTSKDVALLHRNGIIDHLLGSDEHVACLFNQLCCGIVDGFGNKNYLSDIYEDVAKHYKNEWNMWWASLRSDYFTNPWASLSSVAAVIIILLTITQTFYTIFPY